MELSDYLPVLIQVGFALVLGAAVLFFSVKFYIVAMLFILFDIEIVFLIPWVLVYRDFLAQNLPILTPVLFFILLLVAGLIYEMKKGALKWEK